MAHTNPLYKAQREKAGAQTFEKYLYQYHWALYRILKEHEEEREYAVFVELHEDVVLSNSLNYEEAEFEFNQVKTNQAKFTEHGLIKKKNGNSVLGKLINSSLGNEYRDRIVSLNLIATNGFQIDLKESGIILNDIKIDDIQISALQKLSDAIIDELKIDYFPTNLHFIMAELPDKSFQQTLIGYISIVVKKLFPDSLTQAEDIYRPLIDELTRKGTVTFDFSSWDSLIKEKALTSMTVTKVINQFTHRKSDDQVYRKLDLLLNDLELKSLQKRSWERSFERYYLQRIGNKTTAQLDLVNSINSTIDSYLDQSNDEIKELFNLVSEALPVNIKQQFTDQIDLQAAILCELILKE